MHVGKTGQYDQQNVRQVCVRVRERERERKKVREREGARGRDVVKDRELQYLCNRPHAKIIQA